MNKILKWYLGLNIYFKLSPFLVAYILICLLFPHRDPFGDEGRYLWFADNLLHGFYSPAYPDINLWNGPGYPLFLSAFLFLKNSLVVLRLANAFLLYFSLIISYKTFTIYSSKRSAFLFTLLLAMYFPILDYIRTIVTETLSWFLITLITYLFIKSLREKTISIKLLFLSGLSIAYLVMVKIIFGYVIILMMIIALFLYVVPKFRASAKRSLIIYFISFIFCLPWLIYTYNLTNKPFYWGNSGSMSLYTMSTPYEGETGDWYDQNSLLKNPNHTVFIDSILKLPPLEQEEAFKKQAIKNIKTHPKKYASNIISNVGRLLFFPSAYSPDSFISYLPSLPNMFLVVIIVFALALSIVRFKKIPQEIWLLFLFVFIYLAGSSFLSAYRRMFFITVPFWVFFISYVLNNIISIKIKEEK